MPTLESMLSGYLQVSVHNSSQVRPTVLSLSSEIVPNGNPEKVLSLSNRIPHQVHSLTIIVPSDSVRLLYP